MALLANEFNTAMKCDIQENTKTTSQTVIGYSNSHPHFLAIIALYDKFLNYYIGSVGNLRINQFKLIDKSHRHTQDNLCRKEQGAVSI